MSTVKGGRKFNFWNARAMLARPLVVYSTWPASVTAEGRGIFGSTFFRDRKEMTGCNGMRGLGKECIFKGATREGGGFAWFLVIWTP